MSRVPRHGWQSRWPIALAPQVRAAKHALDKVQGTIAAMRTAAIPGARIHLIFLFIAAFVRGTPSGHAARGVSQNATDGRPAAACNRENGEDWAV